MPEDKTNLLAEWKSVEEEINYYIETKLLDFIDYIKVAELSEIKSELKQFIEDQRGYKHSFGSNQVSEPADINSPEESAIYDEFENIGGILDLPINMKNPSSSASLNTSGAKWIKFIIKNRKLGYVWLKQTPTLKGRKSGFELSPGTLDFYPMSEDLKGNKIPLADAKKKIDKLIRSL